MYLMSDASINFLIQLMEEREEERRYKNMKTQEVIMNSLKKEKKLKQKQAEKENN